MNVNETIGSKGGHNDNRRTLKIKKEKLKRQEQKQEEEDLKELEKRVKKQQLLVLIKTIPLIIAGESLKTILDNTKKNKQNASPKKNSNEIETLTEKKSPKEEINILDGTTISPKTISIKDKKRIPEGVIEIESPAIINSKSKTQETEDKEQAQKEETATIEQSQNYIPIKGASEESSYNEKGEELSNTILSQQEINASSLSKEVQAKLEKLKAHKIIDEYEKALKDIRYDLRKLIFEYNVLVSDEKEAVLSKETTIILEKLTEIISKIEELKRKIKIENIEKYDDNYIYTLVEDYLREFKDGNLVKEIQDSPLYVLISKKLDELDSKKDDLTKKVTDKKDSLEEKEIDFDKLKDKYFSLDRLNNELLVFQNEQDRILKEVREKVNNALTIEEKVEVQVEAMNKQSKRFLRMATMALLFPGPRAGRAMATTYTAYLHFLNQILNPKTTTRKYRVITVKDYSRDIENSLSSIDNAKVLLGKTSNQIDKIIGEINTEFRDYLGVVSEADELLSNLKKIRAEVKEKEYEMERIEKEQLKMLELNNAKILQKGKFPM